MNPINNIDRQPELFTDPSARPFPSFNAAAFFARKDRLARLSMVVAALGLIVAGLALTLALSHSRQKVLFVVLDPTGNVVMAPGSSFSEAKELHVQQAMLATTALLLRSPNDFDQPEVLQSLFAKSALTQAASLKSTEAREFMERRLHQKPQITRIDAVATRQEEVQIQITGQVVRSGLVQQAPFMEAIPFILRLVLKPNPDLLRNRLQPTTCHRERRVDHRVAVRRGTRGQRHRVGSRREPDRRNLGAD